ncbi:WAT1-related protein At2g37460-like [Solanum stenotomum]|uniref:WAT1-related protein At2g37460-like n=1 Tax=Solanum stenotomum TaxID=172797 RepID=UPI0020D0E22C|nr:WAT1-related protein At2g37460-like [Solanum stenotomum]
MIMKEILIRAKPFFAVVFLQLGLSGMYILSKMALNEGSSNYVYVVYRQAVATLFMAPFAIFLDKGKRPKMTFSIFAKLVLLSILEPVIDQNLYSLGLKYTTATFAAAMYNTLPAITFIMSWIFRQEKVNFTSIGSQVKIIGTIATLGGVMIMMLVRGPEVQLFPTDEYYVNNNDASDQISGGINPIDAIKGSLMIMLGCTSGAGFIILQTKILQTYPAELSLHTWICLLGTIEGGIMAMIMERGNSAVWIINWDSKFLAVVYSGIFGSGLAYYIQGVILEDRSSLFISAFNPLNILIVAIISSIILQEQMNLGRILGVVVIIIGLYIILWGKSKDHKILSPSKDEQAISAFDLKLELIDIMGISSARIIGIALLIVLFSGIMVSADVLGRRMLGAGGEGGGGGDGLGGFGIGIGGSLGHDINGGMGLGGGLLGGKGLGIGGGN